MNLHQSDVDLILSHRFDNGADFWAGPEGKIYVGNPFSTLGALGMLHELDVDPDHEAIQGALQLIRAAGRADGRIRLGPKTPMYPCYTAEAARVLCRYGLTEDQAVLRTRDYLLENSHDGGGWRCNFTRFGRGPETEYANPGATLLALDVLRFYPDLQQGDSRIDAAIDFLLGHWESRAPLGPCHWGIGTLFLQVEFPFLRYNIFFYVYVLSFFAAARRDPRFREALGLLESRRVDGKIIVERPHRSLKGLEFCAKGRPSDLASKRYNEIREKDP
jgi:hypothetical protein